MKKNENVMDNKTKNTNTIEQMKILKSSKLLALNNYLTIPKEKRFSEIMLLYEKLTPYWVSEFNTLEEKKPKKMQVHLDYRTKMQDLIDSADGDELCQTAMSMYVANKLAHICEYNRNVLINKYLREKAKKLSQDPYNLAEKVQNEQDFKTISNTVYRYLDLLNSPIAKKSWINDLKMDLYSLGLDDCDIENMKKMGISFLTKLQKNAFYIKDFEMLELIEELKTRDDISYGMRTTEQKNFYGDIIYLKNGKPKKEHLLVIDLPYYGQFSVHMKSSESISSLSNTPYDSLKVYEKESMILTQEISNLAMKDFDKKNGISMEKLKQIRKENPRYAHYLALKTGATKQELNEMYDER